MAMPSTGELCIKNTLVDVRSIEYNMEGQYSGEESLWDLGVIASFSGDGSVAMTEWYSFDGAITAPTGIQYTETAGGNVDIDWTDNSSNEAQFRLEGSKNGGAWTWIADVTSGVTHTDDPSVTFGSAVNGDFVAYRVRGENELITSSWNTGGALYLANQ
jgi:hypothetical protein